MTIDENGRKVDYIVLFNRNFAKRKSDEFCPSFSKEPVLCQIDILYAPFMHDDIVAFKKTLFWFQISWRRLFGRLFNSHNNAKGIDEYIFLLFFSDRQ